MLVQHNHCHEDPCHQHYRHHSRCGSPCEIQREPIQHVDSCHRNCCHHQLERTVRIQDVDMSSDMQEMAICTAAAAMDRFCTDREVAAYIKDVFDCRYGPTWHCVMGKHFGSYVTHQTCNMICFYLDNQAFLLFKAD